MHEPNSAREVVFPLHVDKECFGIRLNSRELDWSSGKPQSEQKDEPKLLRVAATAGSAPLLAEEALVVDMAKMTSQYNCQSDAHDLELEDLG